MQCYVYVYLDPRRPGVFEYGKYRFDYEPFYVGFSSRKARMREHLRQARKHKGSEHPKYAKIQKIWSEGLEPLLIHYRDNLEKTEALELEHDMVSTIGRQDLKNGPLTNLTDAGEFNPGRSYKERPQPLLVREKIRKTLQQRYIDHPELRNKHWSEETKQRHQEGLLRAYSSGRKKPVRGGWTLSEETKRAMSERAKSQEHPTGLRATGWKGWVYDPEKDISYVTGKVAAKYEKVSPGAIYIRINSKKWQRIPEPRGTQVLE